MLPADDERSFNGLTASEWASLSRNVWNKSFIKYTPRNKKQLEHGATFPAELAILLIKIYTKRGDYVLDPFVGTGSTLSACRETKRNGIGIELSPKIIEVARRVTEQSYLFGKLDIRVINDDCRNVQNHVQPETIQLILTSPPYAALLHKTTKDRALTHKNSMIVNVNNSRSKVYSEDARDFGNLDYEPFLEELSHFMALLFPLVKPGGYCAWIMKDMRDVSRMSSYICFHADLARIGERNGFSFHDLIIIDQNENRKLMCLGYPSVFYTNQNSSYIVILRKNC